MVWPLLLLLLTSQLCEAEPYLGPQHGSDPTFLKPPSSSSYSDYFVVPDELLFFLDAPFNQKPDFPPLLNNRSTPEFNIPPNFEKNLKPPKVPPTNFLPPVITPEFNFPLDIEQNFKPPIPPPFNLFGHSSPSNGTSNDFILPFSPVEARGNFQIEVPRTHFDTSDHHIVKDNSHIGIYDEPYLTSVKNQIPNEFPPFGTPDLFDPTILNFPKNVAPEFFIRHEELLDMNPIPNPVFNNLNPFPSNPPLEWKTDNNLTRFPRHPNTDFDNNRGPGFLDPPMDAGNPKIDFLKLDRPFLFEEDFTFALPEFNRSFFQEEINFNTFPTFSNFPDNSFPVNNFPPVPPQINDNAPFSWNEELLELPNRLVNPEIIFSNHENQFNPEITYNRESRIFTEPFSPKRSNDFILAPNYSTPLPEYEFFEEPIILYDYFPLQSQHSNNNNPITHLPMEQSKDKFNDGFLTENYYNHNGIPDLILSEDRPPHPQLDNRFLPAGSGNLPETTQIDFHKLDEKLIPPVDVFNYIERPDMNLRENRLEDRFLPKRNSNSVEASRNDITDPSALNSLYEAVSSHIGRSEDRILSTPLEERLPYNHMGVPRNDITDPNHFNHLSESVSSHKEMPEFNLREDRILSTPPQEEGLPSKRNNNQKGAPRNDVTDPNEFNYLSEGVSSQIERPEFISHEDRTLSTLPQEERLSSKRNDNHIGIHRNDLQDSNHFNSLSEGVFSQKERLELNLHNNQALSTPLQEERLPSTRNNRNNNHIGAPRNDLQDPNDFYSLPEGVISQNERPEFNLRDDQTKSLPLEERFLHKRKDTSTGQRDLSKPLDIFSFSSDEVSHFYERPDFDVRDRSRHQTDKSFLSEKNNHLSRAPQIDFTKPRDVFSSSSEDFSIRRPVLSTREDRTPEERFIHKRNDHSHSGQTDLLKPLDVFSFSSEEVSDFYERPDFNIRENRSQHLSGTNFLSEKNDHLSRASQIDFPKPRDVFSSSFEDFSIRRPVFNTREDQTIEERFIPDHPQTAYQRDLPKPHEVFSFSSEEMSNNFERPDFNLREDQILGILLDNISFPKRMPNSNGVLGNDLEDSKVSLFSSSENVFNYKERPNYNLPEDRTLSSSLDDKSVSKQSNKLIGTRLNDLEDSKVFLSSSSEDISNYNEMPNYNLRKDKALPSSSNDKSLPKTNNKPIGTRLNDVEDSKHSFISSSEGISNYNEMANYNLREDKTLLSSSHDKSLTKRNNKPIGTRLNDVEDSKVSFISSSEDISNYNERSEPSQFDDRFLPKQNDNPLIRRKNEMEKVNDSSSDNVKYIEKPDFNSLEDRTQRPLLGDRVLPKINNNQFHVSLPLLPEPKVFNQDSQEHPFFESLNNFLFGTESVYEPMKNETELKMKETPIVDNVNQPKNNESEKHKRSSQKSKNVKVNNEVDKPRKEASSETSETSRQNLEVIFPPTQFCSIERGMGKSTNHIVNPFEIFNIDDKPNDVDGSCEPNIKHKKGCASDHSKQTTTVNTNSDVNKMENTKTRKMKNKTQVSDKDSSHQKIEGGRPDSLPVWTSDSYSILDEAVGTESKDKSIERKTESFDKVLPKSPHEKSNSSNLTEVIVTENSKGITLENLSLDKTLVTTICNTTCPLEIFEILNVTVMSSAPDSQHPFNKPEIIDLVITHPFDKTQPEAEHFSILLLDSKDVRVPEIEISNNGDPGDCKEAETLINLIPDATIQWPLIPEKVYTWSAEDCPSELTESGIVDLGKMFHCHTDNVQFFSDPEVFSNTDNYITDKIISWITSSKSDSLLACKSNSTNTTHIEPRLLPTDLLPMSAYSVPFNTSLLTSNMTVGQPKVLKSLAYSPSVVSHGISISPNTSYLGNSTTAEDDSFPKTAITILELITYAAHVLTYGTAIVLTPDCTGNTTDCSIMSNLLEALDT